MENLNNINVIAKLAGLPPLPEKEAGAVFMDRLRNDEKKAGRTPVFTGD